MTTISFTHPDLNLTETVNTTIESVGKDFVTFASHPDVKVKIDAKNIKDLDLKAGASVKLDPVTNTYTMTVDAPVAPEVTASPKKGSSPSRSMSPASLDW